MVHRSVVSGVPAKTSDRAPGEGFVVAWVAGNGRWEPEVRSRLEAAGVSDDTIVRVSELGDIEVRRPEKWDLIGGLLGDYENRIKRHTGMDWV